MFSVFPIPKFKKFKRLGDLVPKRVPEHVAGLFLSEGRRFRDVFIKTQRDFFLGKEGDNGVHPSHVPGLFDRGKGEEGAGSLTDLLFILYFDQETHSARIAGS